MIELAIKRLDGNIIHMITDDSDTVLSIKSKLHSEGLPEYNKQRLIYGGKELEDHKSLKEYGIIERQDVYTIHLVYKNDTKFVIKIKNPDNTVIEVEYDTKLYEDTVQYLKMMVFQLTKIHPKKFELYYGDVKLERVQILSRFLEKTDTFRMVMN